MKPITEDNIEAFTIEHLQQSGWVYAHGLSLAPGSELQERDSFEQIILIGRAFARLNTTSTKAVMKWHRGGITINKNK